MIGLPPRSLVMPHRLPLVLLFAATFTAPATAQLPPEKAKAAFLKLLDRPKVPADGNEARGVARGGLAFSRWSFASEKKADGTVERVPVLVVSPAGAKGKLPVMIVLHGTGGSKEGVQSWLEDFAKQGIIGVAIDARYHGGRAGGAKGSAAYVEAITRAWRTPAHKPMEHPLYYDTCWDPLPRLCPRRNPARAGAPH